MLEISKSFLRSCEFSLKKYRLELAKIKKTLDLTLAGGEGERESASDAGARMRGWRAGGRLPRHRHDFIPKD